MLLILTLSLSLVIGTCHSTTYEGHKVYKLYPTTPAHNEFLTSLKSTEFDFWSPINNVGKPVTVMASPQVQKKFEKKLKKHKISYELEIDNLQSTIDQEKKYHEDKLGIAFDHYLRHSEINNYLDQLAQNYPNIVSVGTIGTSYENRTMKTITISAKPGPKPVIFIEAGMHAREWIAPALSLYIINQLVENPSYGFLQDVDWVILPVMNPDGYEYTWTTDRMWRKTRSPGSSCNGTDGNRNFGFHWMEKGASGSECSETYAGSEAFSEIETQNLRNVLNKTGNITAFISLHSYGQYLFYPYSYDYVRADNWKELAFLAHKVNDVIKSVNGTEYTIGNSAEVLYPAAGCSDDWAMGGAGVRLVYVFELPGGGKYGFDLPPEKILGVCEETWEGIKVIADYVVQNCK
ncbi:carboxypeptidase A [Tribolium castaneum]|uniref:Zinc carboxypeptidase A 1 n=2 Tax=Tribolium castaneum TaxID=7070 RepID=D6WIV5_TRICA|nr:carboxypeptidase A [Tribolium castaneum]